MTAWDVVVIAYVALAFMAIGVRMESRRYHRGRHRGLR